MRRWPVQSSGSEKYSQLAAGFWINLAKPTGIRDQGWLSRSFSSKSTRCFGSARFSAWRHNRQPQQAMTDGAVALRRDDRFGNQSGVFPRDTMAEENPDHEVGQIHLR
jgi:hypothetical protein